MHTHPSILIERNFIMQYLDRRSSNKTRKQFSNFYFIYLVLPNKNSRWRNYFSWGTINCVIIFWRGHSASPLKVTRIKRFVNSAEQMFSWPAILETFLTRVIGANFFIRPKCSLLKQFRYTYNHKLNTMIISIQFLISSLLRTWIFQLYFFFMVK